MRRRLPSSSLIRGRGLKQLRSLARVFDLRPTPSTPPPDGPTGFGTSNFGTSNFGE